MAVLANAAERDALQRRTLRVLVAGQVLGGGAIGVGGATSPLLAKDILGDDTFAGLAFAGFAFGAAFAAVPLSKVMARHGRRRGLTRGFSVAMFGAVAAVVAAEIKSFPLLLVGMLLFGSGSASNLLARYAGADLARPEHRARSISIVMWATTVGAVAGPNVLGPAGRLAEWLALPRLAGPYVISVGCFLVATAVVTTRLRPDPMEVAGLLTSDATSDTPTTTTAQMLRSLLRRSDAVVGLATMTVAHGVMVSIMAMTPLHLRDHGDSLELVGVVISLHIAGMYAFSPLVGLLADRAGHLRVAYAAAIVLAGASALAAAPGHHHLLIALALFLLGVGWSMASISGSAIISAATPPEQRARTQGVADMTMGIVGGIGGTISGIVLGTVGYRPLSLIGAAIAAALLVAIVARGARTPSPHGAAPA